jgi:TusA-related sulfurtransferase
MRFWKTTPQPRLFLPKDEAACPHPVLMKKKPLKELSNLVKGQVLTLEIGS